jgi:RNA-directed DNA polymerase
LRRSILFDKVSRDWLIRFVEHRIGDRRIIRLMAKWLMAGVLEDGRVIETEEGTFLDATPLAKEKMIAA